MRNPTTRNSQLWSGFTLIELLTVIAIIGILSSLVIVGISAARKRAHAARDTSNLKNIGIANALYTNDNRGLIAPGVDTTVTPNQYWFAHILRPYMGYVVNIDVEAPAFISPLDPEKGGVNNTGFKALHRRSYAINRTMLHGTGSNTHRVNISEATNPARTIYATNYRAWANNSNWIDSTSDASLQEIPDDWRSGNGVGVLFLDGHVEVIPRPQLLSGGAREENFKLSQ